ncbi:MAG: hypothetical protein J6Y88_05255 [Bacteroidales bacterium]|nr:hypothetical protein [Bacteroidales bacterium]
MTKVTIVKNYRNTETLRPMELEEVVKIIQSCEYDEAVRIVRSVAEYVELKRQDDGSMDGASRLTNRLPRVCFASEMENRNRIRVRKSYSGLVLLEVNNLQSYAEAVAVRQGAGLMPQTLLAFVGASGLSVKIVCRGEMFQKGELADEEIARFHLNLYEKARLAYNAQLGVTIDKLMPTLERTCYLSADAGLVWNPSAVPFYTDASDLEHALKPLIPKGEMPDDIVPGRSRYHSLQLIYEYSLSKAYDDLAGVSDDDNFNYLLLTRLAAHCLESGLEMAFAQRQALFSPLFDRMADVVRKVFENTYRPEHERQYRHRMNMAKPLKNFPPETLLTMKIDIFLNTNYELRKNVMRGVAEYRVRTGLGFSFQDLTEEARNSITMRALAQGIKCWDKDIRRYVNSNDIALYDPMEDFLDHLPRWDGKDRVEPLARRVKTDYEEWPHLFHIWMRSMVAMWKGKGQLTGNALVPLLIGRQGCGKSSFCRILLPRDMRDYYNDRINFKNESDLNLGLTSFALINLDEFDKITQRQQIVLKYLVSTADLKYRPPYGKAYSSHRRYASFIGTTNEPMPLVDPTGSRRFICVTVEGNIDFETPVMYDQLYAQLKYEVEVLRERYYLTKDEETALMQHNLRYQKMSGLGEMLMTLFEKPEGTAKEQPNNGQWMSVKDISERLKQSFKGAYQPDAGTLVKIGQFLSRPEYKFESERKAIGWLYWVKERKE